MSICSQALDFQGQLKSLAEILCLQIEKSRFRFQFGPVGRGVFGLISLFRIVDSASLHLGAGKILLNC